MGDLRAPGRSPERGAGAAGPAPRPIRGRRRVGLAGHSPSQPRPRHPPLRAARALGGPEARCPPGWSATRPQGKEGGECGSRRWSVFVCAPSECPRRVILCAISRYCPERPTGRGPSSAVGCARGRRGLSAPRAGRRCRAEPPPRRRRREKRKSPLEPHQMQIL